MKARGYEILGRNVVLAHVGELDIVAMRHGVISFVEVRSRQDGELGEPEETVGRSKRHKLRTLAQAYLDRTGLEHAARFDVASVTWVPEPTVEYIEDAFT
jgi:putative endonuclease